jgi:hypothetical protein
MSSNTLPIDLDKEKLDHLLQKLENRTLTRDEAKELVPLLEKEWKKALSKEDNNLSMEISSLLIALNAFISGRVNLDASESFNRISYI